MAEYSSDNDEKQNYHQKRYLHGKEASHLYTHIRTHTRGKRDLFPDR